MKKMILVVLLYTVTVFDLSLAKLTCRDFKGNAIKHGQEFKPDGDDHCKVCLCDQGFPTMCRSVSCSPPSCPHWEQVKNECCQFRCLEDVLSPTKTPTSTNNTSDIVTSTDSLTTLGLRLVASTVTSFLVLALLLFAVHQLRRKRLILAMRRYSESRRRQENYQPEVFTPDYFGLECPPYEEPPPPYSPPKHPSEDHPSEAPPPYDSVDANHNLSSHVSPVSPTLNHNREQSLNESTNLPSSIMSGLPQTRNEYPPESRSFNQDLSPSRHQHDTSSRSFSQNVSPSRQQNDTSPRSFTLPPWNSFRSPKSHSHEQSYSNSRPLQRGFSENSDIGSDRASTDFGLTSDAESHCNRCDPEENVVLRDLRLANLLLSPRTDSNTTIQASPQQTENLKNDAHYPENTFSNLTQSSLSSGYHGSTASHGNRDNSTYSPNHSIISTQSNASSERRNCDIVERNRRNENLKSCGQSMENKNNNITLKENNVDQNCSDV